MIRPRGSHAILSLTLALTAACSSLKETTAYDPSPLAPPAPSRPWVPPEETAPQKFTAAAEPEPETVYDLPALIDLALRANPETRISWEQTRAAAARAGIADSAYFPTFAIVANGGFSRTDYPTPDGAVFFIGPELTPQLELQWTLLDFGRRKADFESAVERSRQANLQFNRRLQEVAYAVQQSFYRYDASRAQVEAAIATRTSAVSVQDAAEARLARGLATQTEVLLARQERARSEFQVQAARRGVADSQSRLAEALGISPAAPLQVATLSSIPLPADLKDSVEAAMDSALRARPDVAALLAQLRAREAEVERARARYYPEVSLSGAFGGTGGSFRAEGAGGKEFDYVEPIYSAFLEFSWTLFDGFARENRLREAEAQRGEAEAQLSKLQLRALRNVWKSYADVKVALLQYEFAVALLDASDDAYQAAFDGYTAGLADILDLLRAERDLAQARSTMIDSRAELLRSAAALAFAVGTGEDTLVDHTLRPAPELWEAPVR